MEVNCMGIYTCFKVLSAWDCVPKMMKLALQYSVFCKLFKLFLWHLTSDRSIGSQKSLLKYSESCSGFSLDFNGLKHDPRCYVTFQASSAHFIANLQNFQIDCNNSSPSLARNRTWPDLNS